jgi:rubrerythrin
MRAVQNVTETASSVVPSIGSDPEQNPDLYKCRNCGRDVDPDAEDCPNCSSANLRPLYL